MKVKLGFKSFYIYGAVSSETGYSFNLLLPEVNTFGMNVFLERLSKSLKGKRVILVLDGASWHKSAELRIPVNIELMYLPPYSPELNPVEKLWQFIKSKVIRNKIYRTLGELEDAVCHFIKNISNEDVMSNCACSYL